MGGVDEHEVLVGRPRLFEDRGWSCPPELAQALDTQVGQGRTAVLAGRDGRVEAVLSVADSVRPSSREAVAAFHELGLSTILLTGDNRGVAEAVAEEIGVTGPATGRDDGRVIAEVLPDERNASVRDLQDRAHVVANGGRRRERRPGTRVPR